MDVFLSELRYAWRGLRRSPGFTIVAMLTLALGIGANTALFSVVYGVLLRPLDYRDPSRLVVFRVERDFAGRPRPVPANFSLPDLAVWQARTGSFESIAMIAGSNALVAGDGGNDVISVATVTKSFFAMTGSRFTLGRGLSDADDESPLVVISQRLWLRQFGGAPGTIGRQIALDRQLYSIVGVADATFQLPSPRVDVWRPVGFARTLNAMLGQPRAGGFQLFARLRPQATIELAQAEVTVVCQGIDPNLHAAVIPLREWFLTEPVRSTLLVLWTAVGLVLFVACANVANLILARDAARSRETAVRLALGAVRTRLILQALVRGALLAAGGALGGTMLAAALVEAFIQLRPTGIPRLDAVHVDGPVLLFAAALGTLTTFVVGAFPALQSDNVATALKAGGPNAAGSRRVRRARKALVVAELAVTAVLLVGANLLGRSLVGLLGTDIGVSADHVTSALVDVSFGRQLSMAEQRSLIERIVERVRQLPGVSVAGAGASMPPNLARLRFTMNRFDDAPGQPANYMVDAVTATPGYFSALGMRLQAGRFFTDADDPNHQQVMIMTASTARQIMGDRAIGRAITLPMLTEGGKGSGQVTVVGVIADVKYSGLERPSDAVIYRPFAQQPWPSMFIVARTSNDDPAFASTLRRAITAADPAVGIQTIGTFDSLVSEAMAQPRFRTITLVAVAVLATLLAAIGLYGVIAYTVSQRTAEVGIRMALGAAHGDVVGLVLREGAWLGAVGVTLGIVAARIFARVTGGLLYGVQPTDAASFIGAAAVLFLVALVASYVPARRASRIDPLVALRHE